MWGKLVIKLNLIHTGKLVVLWPRPVGAYSNFRDTFSHLSRLASFLVVQDWEEEGMGIYNPTILQHTTWQLAYGKNNIVAIVRMPSEPALRQVFEFSTIPNLKKKSFHGNYRISANSFRP